MKIQCVFVINKDGNRITTIADNFKTKESLIELAKSNNYEGVVDFIYKEDGTDMMNQFDSGKIYSNGEMVDAPVVELSAAEIRKASILELKSEAEIKKDELKDKLLIASLANNTTAMEQIREDYASIPLELAKKIKEVK